MTRATIFAPSTGPGPAGIAIIRISGTGAGAALSALCGRLPAPRRATLRIFRHPLTRDTLDHGLALWFPGPRTATGEDLAELHLHGGRAIIAAVLAALETMAGLRPAEPGEFTRRAFANGRIDLTEAEGLGDLLAAETEAQRRQALAIAEGGLARQFERWRAALLSIAATIEAAIDLSDEEDVPPAQIDSVRAAMAVVRMELVAALAHPPAERLRDGMRVVIAGPPNSGKSTLLNALVGREAAIVSPHAGTTRDIVEAPVVIGGYPFLLSDTAGLRRAGDPIEAIGVERAERAMGFADIILWLGSADSCPAGAVQIASKADLRTAEAPGLAVSAVTGMGLDSLRAHLVDRASAGLGSAGIGAAFSERQRRAMREIVERFESIDQVDDLVLLAEDVRAARALVDRITGRSGTEALLDEIFGKFCVGK